MPSDILNIINGRSSWPSGRFCKRAYGAPVEHICFPCALLHCHKLLNSQSRTKQTNKTQGSPTPVGGRTTSERGETDAWPDTSQKRPRMRTGYALRCLLDFQRCVQGALKFFVAHSRVRDSHGGFSFVDSSI